MDQEFLKKYDKFLSPNDFGFLNRCMTTSQERYLKRIQKIDFCNKQRVLDAGCGFGQWSIALAKNNYEVVGVDVGSERLMVAEDIAKSNNIKNLDFRYAQITDLPFSDKSFDAVFCYGVIFIPDVQKALRELYRVLQPKGRLYFTANGIGFHLRNWMTRPNHTSDYDPRVTTAHSFMRTLHEGNNLNLKFSEYICEREVLTSWCKEIGFEVLGLDQEAHLDFSKEGVTVEPFFKGEYYGLEGVFEIMCEKK